MATFKIKSYTTEVSVEKTAAEIEAVLLAFGATRIMKEFDNGWLTGIRFVIKVEWGEMPIALPANVDGVVKAITKETQGDQRTQPLNDARKMRIKEQAERTAWRLMLNWCHVQLSLIRCKQVEPAQVFMPFAVMNESNGKPVTVFNLFRAEQMKALPTHKDEPTPPAT